MAIDFPSNPSTNQTHTHNGKVWQWNGVSWDSAHRFSSGGGVPFGTIAIWSGAASAIPSGWTLCDGTNGTPDLQDKFVVGAGSSYSVSATGGSADAVVVAHDHGTGGVNGGTIHAVRRGIDAMIDSISHEASANDAHYDTTSVTDPEGVSGTNANLPPYYSLCYIMCISSSTGSGSSTAINDNTDNRVITGSDTAGELNAEAKLTFDGSRLDLTDTDAYIRIGSNANRFELRNNGGSSYLYSYSSSVFHIAAAGSCPRIQFDWVSGVMCDMIRGDAVKLYFNNVEKIRTTGNGVKILGSIEDKDGETGSNGQILSSTGNELEWIDAPTGSGSGGSGNDSVAVGTIAMWSGTIATIPSGWALCDGNNGTPDLLDKFVIGSSDDAAGNAVTGVTGGPTQTGGSKDAIVVDHSHSSGNLTVNSHSHGDGSLSVDSHSHGSGNLATDINTHAHAIQNQPWYTSDVDRGQSDGASLFSLDNAVQTATDNHSHQHNVSSGNTGNASPGISGSTSDASPGVGGNTGSQGSSGTNANLPPYYALAYIMKITAGGGGSSLTIQDEGTTLTTAGTTLNFVGDGVTASGTGAVKTITIAGGSGSGGASSDPIGTIVAWGGASNNLPSGYQLCDGTSSATAALIAIVGNNVPDLRDKFVVGAGNSYSVDATGGSANATVVQHNHGINDNGHHHRPLSSNGNSTTVQSMEVAVSGATEIFAPCIGSGVNSNNASNTTNETTGISIQNEGSSGNNANLPPYYSLCYIIKNAASTGGGGSTIINNNAAERVITGSATAGELNASDKLTLASNGTMTLNGSLTVDQVNINGDAVQLTGATSDLKIRGNGTGGTYHLSLDDHVYVAGDLELNAGVKDKDGELGTSGQILSTTGTEVNWIDAPSGGGATTLGALTDVDVASANTGKIIKFNGVNNTWEVSDVFSGDYADLTNKPGNFTTSAAGLVPVSPGGTTKYLRADGSWQVVSSGGADGNDYLTDLTLSGTTLTAVFTDTSLNQTIDLASINTDTTYSLADENGSGLMPQLQATHNNHFLRADGQWAVTPGGNDGNDYLTDLTLSGTTLTAVFTNTSLNQDVDLASINTDTTYGQFSTSQAGLVPQSPGGTTKYLRADGSWETVTSGGNDGNDYVTNLSLSGTTLTAEFSTTSLNQDVDLASINTDTTYGEFSGTTAGLVPVSQSTTTNKYLRSDGNWSDPPTDGNDYVTDLSLSGTTLTATFGNSSLNQTVNLSGLSGGGDIPSGTAMLFAQGSAPTGWTKSTSHNNKALRVVSGSGGGSGGSVGFTSAFQNHTVSISDSDTVSVGGTVTISGNCSGTQVMYVTTTQAWLSTDQIPSHQHDYDVPRGSSGGQYGFQDSGNSGSSGTQKVAATGGSNYHTHAVIMYYINGSNFSFEGSDSWSDSDTVSISGSDNVNCAVQYVDVIICTKG